MVSSVKRRANQLNAQKSTGPRTAQGKAVAAANALRHGAFAQYLLLPGEDAAELSRLKVSIVRRLDPRDGLELQLVERVVVTLWKLQRIQRFERVMHREETSSFGWNGNPSREACGLGADDPVSPETAQLSGRYSPAAHERLAAVECRLENTLNRTLRQLATLRKEPPIGEPSDLSADVIAVEQAVIEKMKNEATAVGETRPQTNLLEVAANQDDTSNVKNEATDDRSAAMDDKAGIGERNMTERWADSQEEDKSSNNHANQSISEQRTKSVVTHR